ncbi:MAG TPA: DUF5131 family protein, partial [Thermoanaerobaculia bacterium]|nr:DUF5131 family protein [Thermoanaerobaculia bacterium]
WRDVWPRNVWLGTTTENQKYYDARAKVLASIPAAVRFLSCEPLLGPITLDKELRVDWVIVGGESGTRARPMEVEWARNLREQCKSVGAAFFFKQWGVWGPQIHGVQDHRAVRLARLGKKVAGRELDGRTWDDVPHSPTAVLDLSHK